MARGQVMALGAGPDNCRIIGGKCRFLFSFVSQHGGRVGASSCSSQLTRCEWSKRRLMCQSVGAGEPRKVLFKTPASSRGDRAEHSARFPSLTTIPKAPQLFGFGFQTLFSEGLGYSVEIKHLVVYRHLVTHYLISTMMYEQPHE